MAKARIKDGKARTRSKGGRPRQDGARYPSGELRPAGPNPETIARRQALCSDVTMATTPIDVMLANRWITEDQHRTAARYRQDHAHAGLDGPTVPTQRDLSAPASVDARGQSFAAMPAKDVAAVWDSAMSRNPPAANDRDAGQARSMDRYREANRMLTPAQRNEVNDVVLMDSWPQWVLQRRAGNFTTTWERKRDLLIDGLNLIESLYAPRRKAA